MLYLLFNIFKQTGALINVLQILEIRELGAMYGALEYDVRNIYVNVRATVNCIDAKPQT